MFSNIGARQARAPEPIRVAHFTAEGDPRRYRRFHDVRVEVFCRELGWALHPPLGRWSDPFDRGAHFVLAETSDGSPIGIVRGLSASTAFPHRELFETHLKQSGLLGHESEIGTVNALAVRAPYRGCRYATPGTATAVSAAQLLLRAVLCDLAIGGVTVVLATVLGPASARVFRGAGFQFLDRPRCMPGQEGFRVANAGLVLAPSTHPDAGRLARARAYFAECDRHVCAGGSLDGLFTAPPAAQVTS